MTIINDFVIIRIIIIKARRYFNLSKDGIPMSLYVTEVIQTNT